MRQAERICAEIEQAIARGVYADGEKLNEVALAAQFDVSRTPLREAFQVLQGLGLVELVPNRGAFVRRPSATQLVEMFEVMAGLEAWCVSLATHRMTSAQRLFLRKAAHDCAAALEAGQIDAYYAANTRLHETIYEASGNSVLAAETRRMQRRLRPFRRSQLNRTGRLPQSMQEHAAIIAAMEARDADQAADLMRAHIDTLSTTYDAYLDEIEQESSATAT